MDDKLIFPLFLCSIIMFKASLYLERKGMLIELSMIVPSLLESWTIHGRESLEMKFLLRKSLSSYYYTILYYTGCRESRGWADIKQPSKNKFSYNNIIKLRLIYKKEKHFEVIKHFFQTMIFEMLKF